MPTRLSGILPVDKPAGITSHDVVDRARGILGIRKVGHTGTLDPLATGVLVLCVGRYTRLSEFLTGQPKTYSARLRLGVETDTHDADGRPKSPVGRPPETLDDLLPALAAFTGEIDQIPPMYSARKVDGRRLHRQARAGVEIAREPRRVQIDRIDPIGYVSPDLELVVSCSKGTYIRSLARDIGRHVGCGAHLVALRRTRVGQIGIDRCLELGGLEELAGEGRVSEAFIEPADALPELPLARLTEDGARAFVNGNAKECESLSDVPEGSLVRVSGQSGQFLGIGKRAEATGLLQPVRVIAERALP